MEGAQQTVSASSDQVTISARPRGAQLLSWTTRGVERLWTSRLSEFNPEAPLRGGVPVLFPQFGGFGDLVKHGFARTSDWRQVESAVTSDHGVRVQLAFELVETEATLAQWPHRFRARLDISATPEELVMVLAVTNGGTGPARFTVGLHTYLAVADPESHIEGLTGCYAWDGASTQAPEFNQALPDRIRALDQQDVIVHDVVGPVVLRDRVLGTVSLHASGFTDRVVWNPGPNNTLPDLATGDEARFVCIEPVRVTPIHVPEGGTWQGRQHLVLG